MAARELLWIFGSKKITCIFAVWFSHLENIYYPTNIYFKTFCRALMQGIYWNPPILSIIYNNTKGSFSFPPRLTLLASPTVDGGHLSICLSISHSSSVMLSREPLPGCFFPCQGPCEVMLLLPPQGFCIFRPPVAKWFR